MRPDRPHREDVVLSRLDGDVEAELGKGPTGDAARSGRQDPVGECGGSRQRRLGPRAGQLKVGIHQAVVQPGHVDGGMRGREGQLDVARPEVGDLDGPAGGHLSLAQRRREVAHLDVVLRKGQIHVQVFQGGAQSPDAQPALGRSQEPGHLRGGHRPDDVDRARDGPRRVRDLRGQEHEGAEACVLKAQLQRERPPGIQRHGLGVDRERARHHDLMRAFGDHRLLDVECAVRIIGQPCDPVGQRVGDADIRGVERKTGRGVLHCPGELGRKGHLALKRPIELEKRPEEIRVEVPGRDLHRAGTREVDPPFGRDLSLGRMNLETVDLDLLVREGQIGHPRADRIRPEGGVVQRKIQAGGGIVQRPGELDPPIDGAADRRGHLKAHRSQDRGDLSVVDIEREAGGRIRAGPDLSGQPVAGGPLDQLERAEAQGPPLILHRSRGIERLPTHEEAVGAHLPGQPGTPQRASHFPGQRQPSLRREAQPERGGDIDRPEILGPHAHVDRASGIDGPGSVEPGSIDPGLGLRDPDAPGLRGQVRLGVVDPLPAHAAAVERNLARHRGCREGTVEREISRERAGHIRSGGEAGAQPLRVDVFGFQADVHRGRGVEGEPAAQPVAGEAVLQDQVV